MPLLLSLQDAVKDFQYWVPALFCGCLSLYISRQRQHDEAELRQLRRDAVEIYDRACMGFYSLHHQVSEFRGEAAVCCCVYCNVARRQLGVPELKEGKTMKTGPLHKD